VKESFGENFSVGVNQKFQKSWTFRNDGNEIWPEDTKFIYTNGEDLAFREQMINKEVLSGETIDITIEMQAPAKSGKYCTFFRFS